MNKSSLPQLTSNFPTNKRVLLRVDFNVPVTARGKILDTRRILNHKATIKFLLEKQCQLVLLAHLGQPQGQFEQQQSFQPLLPELQELLGVDIQLVTFNDKHPQQSVTLLENLRFWPGEENNTPDFVKVLATWGDIYVNDAFSVSHRSHASITGLPKVLPSFAGPAFTREIDNLSSILHHPARPTCLIIGGKKVSDKIATLVHLLPIVDYVLIGGASANTFAAARGESVKNSLIEESMVETCATLLKDAHAHKIVLPLDYASDNQARLDIGPKTIELFSSYIAKSKTVVWAGPMGKYEVNTFNKGNHAILQAITQSHAKSIIGGGDTLTALQSFSELTEISFLSLGGSAMLEFLAKETLVGIDAIRHSQIAHSTQIE